MQLSTDRINALQEFVEKNGLKFTNYELLNNAFCHTSYVYENKLDRLESYERLEFLGDAVLKLAVSTLLYTSCPEKKEGELTVQRAVAVSDKTIAEFARKIGIDKLLLTGKCEMDDKKGKETLHACAFEAFLGALYLENKSRGYKAAEKFIITNFKDDILNVVCSNPKAELQEFTQAYNHTLPEYVVMEETGPAHNKMFVVGVYFENEFIDKGSASSKKGAEFEAAEKALIKLKKKYKDKQK